MLGGECWQTGIFGWSLDLPHYSFRGICIKSSYSIHAFLLTISVVPMGLVITPLRDTGTEAAI